MLRRTHVLPFTAEAEGRITVRPLDDSDGRVIAFLDRLCRLMRRLEGRPRSVVHEALRRQERRVRDARRLAGLAKTLLDAARFAPDPLAGHAAEVRETTFEARGRNWPPVPGDEDLPYRDAARRLGLTPEQARDALYADRPGRWRLARAPRWDGRRLLRRYNLELARAVLLDAVEMTVTARGGWGDIFRAVKLGRLMYRIERVPPHETPGRAGRDAAYRVHLTGPAAPFVTRSRRYGARFARVVPALTRAPGWRLDASIEQGGRRLSYALEAGGAIRTRARRPRYDSAWERGLAAEFEAKIGDERGGWSLAREDTPIAVGDDVFLPDFTFRHHDGREALVEIVGFWTPEYLRTKLDKVRRVGLDNLLLVVYRGLAAGVEDAAVEAEAPLGNVLWFARKPRIGAVMDAVERVAR
ncbi:MAG: DUF790 family protein [Gemmatimonadota bacterium]